jgi:hypothetical protein
MEVTGDWREFRNKEFQNIIRVKKSMRMRWIGRVTCMEAIINASKILDGKS